MKSMIWIFYEDDDVHKNVFFFFYPKCGPLVVPRTILGETFVTRSLSIPNVLVTANPHPCSNALLIISWFFF